MMETVKGRDRTSRALLVSFSGLDGSGKSTQIAALTELLEGWGYRVRRLAFWDDVVVLTRYREGFVHAVFHSETGIGAPEKPVNRRDKNMRGWHLSLARHLLYLADTLHLRWIINRERRRPYDAIIVDRYIYDELANLPLRNPISRGFIRLMSWLAPRPDVAFLLDTDPELARARKPEYPVEFLCECRGWYFELEALLHCVTVIPPLPLQEAQRAVAQTLRSTVGTPTAADLALYGPKSA